MNREQEPGFSFDTSEAPRVPLRCLQRRTTRTRARSVHEPNFPASTAAARRVIYRARCSSRDPPPKSHDKDAHDRCQLADFHGRQDLAHYCGTARRCRGLHVNGGSRAERDGACASGRAQGPDRNGPARRERE
jgi:hypothetical protein